MGFQGFPGVSTENCDAGAVQITWELQREVQFRAIPESVKKRLILLALII
jgi:hypothetical protein